MTVGIIGECQVNSSKAPSDTVAILLNLEIREFRENRAQTTWKPSLWIFITDPWFQRS